MNTQLVLATAFCAIAAVGTQAQKAGEPFLRIGDDVTTFGEFDRLYKQNDGAALLPMTEAEYAELFIGFKLKVAEARAQRLDTLKSYVDECRFYTDELAKPYLEDSMAFARLSARERERQKSEVRAEHILISVRPNASPADTLRAYERAQEIRGKIMAGANFAAMADLYSDDPSVKSNHGDLGHFSALQMTQKFEDVAFALKVGEVSEVFRTRYGFHFMKLTDRREAEGQVSVRHIMKVVPSNSNEKDEVAAKAQIDSLWTLATAEGADFESLAKANSDDRQSAARGGIIPWFSRSQILPEFAEAAFAIEEDGEVSRPVRTRAGWHIIKRVGRRTMMPESEFRHVMERMGKNIDDYKNANEESKMIALAKEYSFQWDSAGLDTLVARSLKAELTSSRRAALNDNAISLARIDGKTITLADVAGDSFLWRPDAIPAENVRRILCSIVKNYERSRLEEKFPDFAFSKKEYAEGLLVFELMQRKVWGLAPDSAAVDSLFASNERRYSQGGVFDGAIYFCGSPKVAKKVKSLLANGNDRKARSLAYEVVDGPIKQGGIYDDFIWPLGSVSDYVVVFGHTTDGTPMKLDECRGSVISDWQLINDKKLVAQLKEKYSPKQLLKIKEKK